MPVRGHYWTRASECWKGDAMDDSVSLTKLRREVRLRQRHADSMRPGYEQIIPRIEMVIGTWHVDEFRNKTREITARD
jgi:hypothetical protein